MPKVVDHEERRRELGEAVWRVIRSQGVEGATVRAVAAEAGWSPGALRHYFSSQDDLLRSAMELIVARVPQRLDRHLRVPADGADLPATAARLLEELLPLDQERHLEMQVWLAFADRARIDPSMGEVWARVWEGQRSLCRIVVAGLDGRPPDSVVADQPLVPREEALAEQLHALLDGLALQAVAYPGHMRPTTLRRVLHDHLRAVSEQLGG